MPAGDYTPKYKVGYTIYCPPDFDTQYIIVGTYRGLGQFSQDYARGCVDYDERDNNHVLYSVFNPTNRLPAWRWEYVSSIYCCNANRGKKILLENDNLKSIIHFHSIQEEGLHKFIAMLSDQPTEA